VGVYLGPDIELTFLATASYRRLKNVLGSADIYAGLREKLEALVHEAVRGILERLETLDGLEKFRFAIKVAAAGNALDLSRPYLDPYVHNVDTISRIELKRNDMLEVYERIVNRKITHAVYVFDNSLEALYDTALIKTLQEFGVSVVGIVKSEKFEDDLTATEAKKYGLISLLDDVIETGSDAASLLADEVDENAIRALEEADLVILKGPLNYLHFKNNPVGRPTYALMRVPCKPLASELGVTIGSYVAVRV
jgi:uncharacterized protein with ATP-grasp and redox domains